MKLNRIIVVVILIMLVACGGSFASELDLNSKANVVNKLSILQGDNGDYNLNGTLTRAEAATFVTRMLGKEAYMNFNGGRYDVSTFPDVKSGMWYSKYIGYCVEQKIIEGFPDGTFRPNDSISEKAFLTMVLKAAGYTNDDFSWAHVYSKAYEVGILEDITYAVKEDDNMDYKRKNVVEAIYNTLEIKEKNTNKGMFNKLIDNNIVSESVAKGLGFENKKVVIDYNAITKVVSEDTKSIKVTFKKELKSLLKADIEIYREDDGDKKVAIKSVAIAESVATIVTTDMDSSVKYVVKIKSSMSKDDIATTNLTYTFTSAVVEKKDAFSFVIERVEPIDDKTVDVYFTQPVGENSTQSLLYELHQNSSRWVEGGFKTLSVSKLIHDTKGVRLTLLAEKFVTDLSYEIVIKGDFRSIYEQNLNEGEIDSKEFVARSKEFDQLKAINTSSDTGNYFTVEFNNNVDLETAKDKSNYKLKDPSNNSFVRYPEYIFVSNDVELEQRYVVLRFSSLQNDHEYRLFIEDVKDQYKLSEMEKTEFAVLGSTKYQSDLDATLIMARDKYTIDVYFDAPLSESSIAAYTKVSNSKSIIKKQLDPNNKRHMILYLSRNTPLVEGTIYTLTFTSGLRDYANRLRTAKLEIDFGGVGDDKLNVEPLDVAFINENLIKIQYNQEMDASDMIKLSNYEIKSKLGDFEKIQIPTKITRVGVDTAIITLDKVYDSAEYDVTIKNVYDFSRQFKLLNETYSVRELIK